jgi:hypothetical protein
MQSNLFESLKDMIEYPQMCLYENIPSFKMRGTKRLYIENGKQSCIDYRSNNKPFDAVSRSICCVNVIKNITNQCIKYCTKDCIDFEVKQTNNEHFSSFDEQNKNKNNTNDLKEVQIFWDKNYPSIS